MNGDLYIEAAALARIYRVKVALIWKWAERDNWRRTRTKPIRYHAGDAQDSWDKRRASRSMSLLA